MTRFDLDQCEVTLAFFGWADLPRDRVAGAKVELPDLRRGNVDVVRSGKVVVLGCAQEPETVRQTLQNTFGKYESAFFGLRLKDFEDEVLLAHAGCAADSEILRDFRKTGDVHLLELGDVQRLLLLAARRLVDFVGLVDFFFDFFLDFFFDYFFGARRMCFSITFHNSFLPSFVTAEKVIRGTFPSVP